MKSHSVDRAAFGARLKQVRQVLGLSAAEFAELIGLERQSVYYAESGRNLLSLDAMQRLSMIHRVSIDWLLTGVGSMFTSGPAAAAASVAEPAAVPYAGTGVPGRMFLAAAPDAISLLERLAALREKGTIDDDELESLKAEILVR